MKRPCPVRARWHAQVDAVAAPPELRPWLACEDSLTARLTASCREFRVQVLRESSGRGLDGECAALGLAPRRILWQREVLLRCDATAVVFARTVAATDGLEAWPRLRGLGENPLGAVLFADPLVARKAFRFAALSAGHPLRNVMRHAHGREPASPLLYARRSAFERRRQRLLVTEVFLPAILELSKHEPVV